MKNLRTKYILVYLLCVKVMLNPLMRIIVLRALWLFTVSHIHTNTHKKKCFYSLNIH